MRFVFALIVLVLAAGAAAQSVRSMTSPASFVRASFRQAQKEGRDWPDLSGGEDGTVVHLSADRDDADMTVVSTTAESRLLDAVRNAALGAGLPKTDYLKRQGSMMATADAEFNDYLRVQGRDTRFEFPLARLLEGLRRAKLPGPLRVAIEKGGSSATLVGPKGRLELDQERTLFTPEELAGYDVLTTHFHVEWWAPLAAWAFLLFLGGMLLGPPVLFLKSFRTQPFIGPPPPPPTPEEVQAVYDAQAEKPVWKSLLRPSSIVFVLPMAFVFAMKTAMSQAMAAMPAFAKAAIAWPWSMPTVFLLYLPLFAVRGIRSWRTRKETPEASEATPLRGMWPMFVGLFFMMAMVPIVRARPEALRAIPAEYRKIAVFAFPVLMGGLSIFLMWRNARSAARVLPADDPVFIAAHELAARAGVRVRRVVERKEGGPNAFASLFGTVGVTAKLRETLDETEMRAVIAHEIGHLKASDPWRTLALTLPILAVALGLSYWVEDRTPLGEIPLVRFGFQMFFLFGLPLLTAWLLSPRRRRAEHAADRFALDQVGDVETVARALVKIHDANLTPHRLHPRDERLASHPALERRLARLRETAGEPPAA